MDPKDATPAEDEAAAEAGEEEADGGRDSGAEVSEDEVEEVGLCEGSRLVELIMTTLRQTCSLLLLSPNTDVKNGTDMISPTFL